MPNLRIRDAGKEYTRQIDTETVVLGRGDTNDIDIEDAKASKEHCRIERVGQRWKLVDLESKNGTKVNGAFKNKAWLGHGDVVQIGTAELRFGLEAAARSGAVRKPAAEDVLEGEEGEEEELPRRRPKSNLPLMLGVGVPVGIGILVLLINLMAGSSVNPVVLSRARGLVQEGRYADAIQYAEQNGDNSQNDWVIIERFLTETRELKAHADRNSREQEATRLESKVNNLILSYNRGHPETGPEQILPLVKRLREEFSDTDAAARVRASYPAWYRGVTPERASDVRAGGGRYRKEWDEVVARSEQHRKGQAFREARETVERFVTEREAVLDAEDLATYKQLRDEEVAKLDQLAESVYRGRQSEAEKLLKVKRYDEAIAIYRAIVEKFGIDAYVRQAQAEITRIEGLKKGGQ
jgi:hypothetical protein